jgi:hypothetical protein
MKKRIFFMVGAGLLLVLAVYAYFFKTVRPPVVQAPNYHLPTGAVILETRTLPPKVSSPRTLLLWMLHPTKNPRDSGDEEIYSCPEETRGSYYHGLLRLSLVNGQTGQILQTLEIEEDADDKTLDIPYRIHQGSYYQVDGVAKGQEGKPTIMALRDYNGDGQALEFALFDAIACMGLATTLIGYREQQDNLWQYPVELTIEGEGEPRQETWLWPDYLFSIEPCRPGCWDFQIDYRGRGGSLDTYQLRYNSQKERLEGTYHLTTAEDLPSPDFPGRCQTNFCKSPTK